MADLKLLTVPPPYNGMNSVAPPGKCPEGTAPLVKNALVHIPGKLPMRGPITRGTPYHQTELSAERQIITGIWEHDDNMLVGVVDKDATATVPYWVQPYYRTTLIGRLANAEIGTRLVNLKTKTNTFTVIPRKNVPGGRSARVGNNAYGFAFGWEIATPGSDGYLRTIRTLHRWNGFSDPIELTNAPKSGQDVISYLERLFVLGGGWDEEENVVGVAITNTSPNITGSESLRNKFKLGDTVSGEGIPANTSVVGIGASFVLMSNAATKTVSPATITIKRQSHEPNTIFYSDAGGPVLDSTDYWKDDVSGLLNRIVVGNEDKNDFGVRLAVVGQTLIIFKRNSIWALYGYSPSTFQIRNLTTERGCIDPHSVCEIDGGVYFASQYGIEYFNGSEFTLVDSSISNITRPIAQHLVGPTGVSDPQLRWGKISIVNMGNDYIFLCLSNQVPSTGVIEGDDSWTGYMHTPTGNWSEFTTTALKDLSTVAQAGSTNGVPWLFDGKAMVPVPFITDPWTAAVSSVSQADTSISEVLHDIPFEFWSDRINLSSPGYMSQFHRFLFDYSWPSGPFDTPQILDGPRITLLKSKDSEPIFSDEEAPGHAYLDATSFISGRRWSKDVFMEATDCQLRVSWNSENGHTAKLPEIYDATFEIQVTRQRGRI